MTAWVKDNVVSIIGWAVGLAVWIGATAWIGGAQVEAITQRLSAVEVQAAAATGQASDVKSLGLRVAATEAEGARGRDAIERLDRAVARLSALVDRLEKVK